MLLNTFCLLLALCLSSMMLNAVSVSYSVSSTWFNVCIPWIESNENENESDSWMEMNSTSS